MGSSMTERVAADKWVTLARVGRPHGIRGEVKVQTFNDASTLLFTQEKLRLRRKGQAPRMLELVGARPGGAVWIVRFAGVDDRDLAAELTHGQLSVPRSVLPDLPSGEFYHVDIVGVEVHDQDTDQAIGKVRHIHDQPSDLLEIRLLDGGDVLLPMGSDYIVELSPERVVVRDLHDWQV
ncbi:MAG: 16S rRNA processing protein RimM [Myxococcales bacterium]|nr:16S rRNA processing protein RimM [Myxococcales bacterium]